MPKIGIIYNDIKPVACQVTQELKARLEGLGHLVKTATGIGGILGYSKPDHPICHTPIESLVPDGFDEDMAFAIVLGGDGTVLSAFRRWGPGGQFILAPPFLYIHN